MTNNLGNEFRFLKFDEICGDNDLEMITETRMRHRVKRV